MATAAYMIKRWAINGLRNRPQAILWADNFGVVEDGQFIDPSSGGSATYSLALPTGTEYDNFLILSDDNRSELSFSQQRIENRQRMINGTMRTYYIADKVSVSWSWDMLPSRSFSENPEFITDPSNPNIGKPGNPDALDFTSDGGAGGVEILNWYETHPGSFWMLLSYDKYNNFSGENKYNSIGVYNEVIEVTFSSFEYEVIKRGGKNHDFWSISVTVEEV
jgi:hypothetical protein